MVIVVTVWDLPDESAALPLFYGVMVVAGLPDVVSQARTTTERPSHLSSQGHLVCVDECSRMEKWPNPAEDSICILNKSTRGRQRLPDKIDKEIRMDAEGSAA